MKFEEIITRKLTLEEMQDMREQNERIMSSILQKIASHNIRNPHFSRIKAVLDEMTADLEKRMQEEIWVI